MSLLNFKDVGKFSLIEEREGESIFLQLNEQAKDIWEQYIKIWDSPLLNTYQKKQEFSKIKSIFYDFVINVPIPRDKKSIGFDDQQTFGFYLSKFENPTKFYSYSEDDLTQNTGYKELELLSF